ncbi:MAG: UTP--glucose-1-phosphate uridylyltransferase [Rhodospirillales bacterium]|nr:UTP--glucose-1-phosphate uridylyltransferase [Rhodospirillales bacterium]MDE0379344.1 UTP--glucose-1-phosphate uridylyltransferase [Rhodospirillales bacterium]
MPQPVRKAVLPVAGMATRFLPASKAVPKVMLPVVDKPLIQYAVEEARAAGIEEFIFVTGRGEAAIADHFGPDEALDAFLAARGDDTARALAARAVLAPGAAAFTRQEEPLGLGHAVLCARHLVGDEPFAVLLADELLLGEPPCLAELVEVHGRTGGSVVALAEVPQAETNRYGIAEIAAEEGRTVTLSGMVEKPEPGRAPSRLALIGRYVLQPAVFARLAAQPAGAGGEIQLTDAMAAMASEAPFYGVRFTGRRFDCGSPAGYLQATVACALERAELRQDLLAFLRGIAPSP